MIDGRAAAGILTLVFCEGGGVRGEQPHQERRDAAGAAHTRGHLQPVL